MSKPGAGLLPEVLLRRRARKPAGVAQRIAASAAVVALASLAYLTLGEIALRFATHTSLLDFADQRALRAARNKNPSLQHDALLGWRLRSHIAAGGFNTLEYGLRSNGKANTHVRTGGILAVGSSFTAGSEVVDEETWSAHLEQLTGRPVNNGGQGGYGADQIMLIAEQLLPILKPEVLVVDLLADNILGVGYSSYGMPKPHFSVEAGRLVHHNNPVPNLMDAPPEPSPIKTALARFISVDRFMLAFFSDFWLTSGRSTFTRTGRGDEVEVTCLLLDRLRAKTEAAGVRLLLYLQYAGGHIIGQTVPPTHVALVARCAESYGIQVVDEFETLTAAAARSLDELRTYYVREPDGTTGHKSSFGNREVAKLLQAALAEPARPTTPARTAGEGRGQAPIARAEAPAAPIAESDGLRPAVRTNLLRGSESLHLAAATRNVSLQISGPWWRRKLPVGATQFALTAVGSTAEHHLAIPLKLPPGRYTISLQAQPGTTPHFELQVVNGSAGTAVAIDLARSSSTMRALGADPAQGDAARITAAGRGWQHVALTTILRQPDAEVRLRLLDPSGKAASAPPGASLHLRGIQVERGSMATKYAVPRGLEWWKAALVRMRDG